MGPSNHRALDSLYVELLRRALPTVQLAVAAGDNGWALAEIEFVHNVPSLIGERNRSRHEYFCDSEWQAYREWAELQDGEHAHRMRTLYEPLLNKLIILLYNDGRKEDTME
jgi:hypothetical protein